MKPRKQTHAYLYAALALAFAACSTSCFLQTSKWGLDAITDMATPADPALVCPAKVQIPADTLAPKRASCAFGSGALVAQTLGISPTVASSIPIRHVIVLMKENRSFDHLLGKLHDQGQPGVEAVPADYANYDVNGNKITPFHATTTCLPVDPGHQEKAITTCVDNGEMDGFVKSAATSSQTSAPTDGHFVMSYYESSDVPFYYWLASTFAISDRHFAPMESGTYANRNFLMLGTNAGVSDTGLTFPDPSTPSIFQTLMNAGYTWRAYTDGSPFSGSLNWNSSSPGVHPLKDLFTDLDNGTLPNVAFVDGLDDVEDDHPPSDLQVGEAWARNIYAHAITSPQWPRLAIFWTYDEGGAFADHVPPPPACPSQTLGSPSANFGPRVPLVAISPWAKPHYVSHAIHDHTAILRFIETLFGLPALTARDANSDALFDLFDFSKCGSLAAPPPAPASGTSGCTTASSSQSD